ncbi:HAD family phosphatase [Sphingomonas aerophila]|uniref:2-haloacid dehalogenase n=1 Tax=Sphingomonas aerophila TaxID=1344948 RepID=A0A7W9B9X4_9SPHN|nr:2-haloacid dehalogenase [Sphingomonas aerophila]
MREHEGIGRPSIVVFDVGNVLYDWNPRFLYQRLIEDDRALDAFLRDVVTKEWHFQHDEGRDFSDTSAELVAQHPHHAALIAQWGPRFAETITGTVPGMAALVDELHGAGVPLYAITNFSHEFWPPFRAREAAMFDRFRGIVVSGDEKMVKPHAPIYHLALDRWGLNAGDTLFIDDRADNVEGARGVGMHAVEFRGAEALRDELARFGLLPAAR